MIKTGFLGGLSALMLVSAVSDGLAQSAPRTLDTRTQTRGAEAEVAQPSEIGRTGATPRDTSRVIGGDDVGIRGTYEFTANVAIGQFQCGGSFVAPKFAADGKTVVGWERGAVPHKDLWVVTAAHCLESNDSKPGAPKYVDASTVTVRGGHPDRDQSDKISTFKVIDFEPHPDYRSATCDGPYCNDIALLEIEATDVNAGSDIRAIPLAPPHAALTVHQPGAQLVVNGWGRTANKPGNLARYLQTASVPYADQGKCADAYAFHGAKIQQGSFCAGFVAGGVDSCQGDSGGPLFFNDLRGQIALANGPVLVGVVSWGPQLCASPDLLGIYSSTIFYGKWVAEALSKLRLGT